MQKVERRCRLGSSLLGRVSGASLAAGLPLCPGVALAQGPRDPTNAPAVAPAPAASPAPAPAPSAAASELPSVEIIVTARKRSEVLRDVPVAITAIGGEQLAAKNITQLVDVGALV